jgi:RecB family exonuclease
MLDKTKNFSWSFSKLKNFETCPRRYQEVDLNKSVEATQGGVRSEALERGDELHEAMRNRVQGSSALPPHFIYMNSWAEKLTKVLHPYQIIQCELKLSTDREGKPTGYFDKTTWLRGKIDYLRLLPTEEGDQGHIVDYKTGKPPRIWDGTQLLLNAHLAFSHYKHMNKVRVDYLWTEYNDTTHQTFTRNSMPELMTEITPRVAKMEDAHRTGTFEPKPCGLCKDYCPVASCEFHGKALRR